MPYGFLQIIVMQQLAQAFFLNYRTSNKCDFFFKLINDSFEYHRVPSSNESHLESHSGYYRLLMKGIFDAYVL